MKLYTSQYYNISVSTTKTLFKFKNNKTGNEIKISVNDLKKAYKLENVHINTKLVLSRTLFLLDYDVNHLKNEIKKDKKRFEAFTKLQDKAKEIEKEYFPNYSYRSLFKELFCI